MSLPDYYGDAVGSDHVDSNGKPRKGASTATKLVQIAEARFRFAQADDGRSFAVPLVGPAIARPLESSRSGLRAELARIYFDTHGNAPTGAALTDAIGVLNGKAGMSDREPLHLRVGRLGTDIVLDLGDSTGRCVLIEPGRWSELSEPPITFRRTELTSALPAPVADGDLHALRQLVNVTDRDWPLLVGWLVAVLFDIPRPLLFLTGEQGTGKTTAAKMIVQSIDPSPAPTRAAPRDLDAWITAAAGSQVVALDNLSTVPDWLSDALCRASTGEGMVKRALYTDDGLSVVTFRRAIVLTSIDAGALRGDLGERLVPVELERISTGNRRTDADLAVLFDQHQPHVLSGLCTLAAQVLEALPTINVADLPRMADFGRILAAIDTVTGWQSLDAYRTAAEQVAADVVQGDALAVAVLELMETSTSTSWTGSATELMRALERHRPDGAAWPKSPKMLSGSLLRLAPALRTQGVEVDRTRSGANRALHIRSMTAEVSDASDAVTHLPSVHTLTREKEERPW